MGEYIQLTGSKIRYRITGQGHCVVLIHGYLENMEIWNDYANALSGQYRVLVLDLPGHGKSACNMESVPMDYMADCLKLLMDQLSIARAALVGHSMGGYMALSFAERYPERLAGLCLLHSTPNADSPDKRDARLREIDLVRSGKKGLLFKEMIPNRFADRNLSRFSKEIEALTRMAIDTPDAGVVGALNGMANRPDRNAVIEKAQVPVHFIFGRADNLIPAEVARRQEERHGEARVVYLENSGHTGFIEERDQALSAIASFLNEVFSWA
jgi:pimeloyl-ACP methyl ester carboxylesterase